MNARSMWRDRLAGRRAFGTRWAERSILRIRFSQRLRTTLILLLASMVSGARGQSYTFSNYGLASGLTNVNVTTMLESHTGVIWVATQKGVFRANGSRFEEQPAFDAAGMEAPWAMSEDNEGRLWSVDGHHLAYLENGNVRAIPDVKLHLLSVDAGLIRVPAIPETIFLHSDSKLERIATRDGGKTWKLDPAFKPEVLSRYPELSHLVSVTPGRGSMVWAGCGKAICEIDLVKGTRRKFALREGVSPDTWMNVLLTRTGEVWARGQRSMAKMRPGETRFSPIGGFRNVRSLNAPNPVLLEDRQGRVLLNLTDGLIRSDGKSWQKLNEANGLPQDEIDALLLDHAGGLWLAPAGRGISRWLGYGEWEGWTKATGLSSNTVLGIAKDRTGKRWIATANGLDMLGPQGGTVHRFRALASDPLTAVVVQGDHLWTGDGLGRVVDSEPARGHTRVRLQHLDTVYQILADREDRVWVCSPKGLDYFTATDQWSSPHHVKALPQGNAYGITEGIAGLLWVMTEKGMYRLEGTTWVAVPLPVHANGYYNLMAAAAPDGTLWVQSRHPSAIVHLKIVGRTASVLSRFSDPVMQSENLGFMGFDHRGWLWVESDRGVRVFNGVRWVRCTAEDGLLYDNANYPAFFADPDGSIWIGTSSGLAHLLHPERIFQIPKPTLNLQQIQLQGIDLHEGAQGQFDLRKPLLRVSLFSTDYDRSGAITFRYILHGLEDLWQETTEDTLRFPALGPGHYTLRVAAVDSRLHETSEEKAVSFTILEPWWNRGWFHGIEGLLTAGVLFGAWRLNIRLLLMRQRELEAMVASRTGELEQEKAELLSTRSELVEMTRRDTLTGLLNRAAIFNQMHLLCADSLAKGTSLAIVMADIDHFKQINDRYGHVVGDIAIRECADRISRTIRPVDFVGRYGGEELLILMPGLEPARAKARMEELRAAVAVEPVHGDGVELQMTCSFGVTWMGNQICAIESLVNSADEALYLAKKNGRNRFEFASDVAAGASAK